MRTWLFVFLACVSCQITAWAQDALIRNGDAVEVRIGGVPAEEISVVSGSYQVDESGYINLPNLGKIKAEGQSQASLQKAIEDGYRSAQIYTAPNITINLAGSARYVNLTGDVKSPGRIPYTPDLTVFTAITAAGGFTEYAKQNKVHLMRDGKLVIVDVPEIRRDPSKDIRLKPGDSIDVPRSLGIFGL